MNLENLIFDNNSLPINWDFIANDGMNEKIQREIKVEVKMGNLSRMIELSKSTLTGEYSFQEMKRNIKMIFNIAPNENIIVKLGKQIIMNDQMIQKMSMYEKLEIEIMRNEDKKCIMCLKIGCSHQLNDPTKIDKKRKTSEKKEINLLEPTKNSIIGTKKVISSKKRKVSCVDLDTDKSQDLSFSFGTLIF